ncbi:hypothetical protein MCC01966_19700 [Bifidobacteriaceae bacterium MCC01966]|nr:hypothetical protein MCC01966_19700 [Bifidobacteriaceae bacterium MCC01966]
MASSGAGPDGRARFLSEGSANGLNGMPAAYAKNRVCIRRAGYAWGMHQVMHTIRASLFRMVPPIPGDGLRRYA